MIKELEQQILLLDDNDLNELLTSIEDTILESKLFVPVSKFNDLTKELKNKSRECDSFESENDDYKQEVMDLERRVWDLEYQKEQIPINSLKDELKLDFIKQIWERYELEKLEEIFMWDPIKGIQK